MKCDSYTSLTLTNKKGVVYFRLGTVSGTKYSTFEKFKRTALRPFHLVLEFGQRINHNKFVSLILSLVPPPLTSWGVGEGVLLADYDPGAMPELTHPSDPPLRAAVLAIRTYQCRLRIR